MFGRFDTLAIGITMLIGGGAAFQVALLGAIGRERGPAGASWVSILGTVTGLALLLGLITARGYGRELPMPFDRPAMLAIVALTSGTLLALALRGISPYYAGTGLFAVAFLVSATFLGPRLGIGLFFGAAIAGQLIGAVVLDHLGVFGATPRHVDPVRLVGVATLLCGVLLIRGGR